MRKRALELRAEVKERRAQGRVKDGARSVTSYNQADMRGSRANHFLQRQKAPGIIGCSSFSQKIYRQTVTSYYCHTMNLTDNKDFEKFDG